MSDLDLLEPAVRIDRAWIREHSGLQLALHMSMSDCHVLIQHVIDRRSGKTIGIQTKLVTWKKQKRNGDRAGRAIRTWLVEGHAEELETLEEAIEIYRAIRFGELVE